MNHSRVLARSLLLAAAGLNTALAGEELVLIEKVVSEKTVDIGPKGDSMGDVLVFANPVYAADGSSKVGSDQGYCLRVVVGKSWECTWTVQLQGGQIMAAGPIRDDDDSSLAVVGGTGKYTGARGVLQVHARDGKSYDFKYVLQ